MPPKTKPEELNQEDCKRIEYLIGPIELDILYHHQAGNRIILLGDMHVNEKKCPPDARCGTFIWSYLEQLFDQYSGMRPIDFFLELDFAEDIRAIGTFSAKERKKFKQVIADGAIISNFLTSLRIYFYNCFQTLKRKCEYFGKPIRFHYSDIRYGVIHSGTDRKEQIIIKQLRKLRDVDEKAPAKEKDLKLIQNIITKFRDGDIDYFFRLMKIDKQLTKMLSQDKPEIVQLLREYMLDHIESSRDRANYVYDTVGKHLNLIKLKRTLPKEMRQPNLPNVLTVYISILLSPLFDIYTLARMFRHDMKQVIVYAGAFHTQKMKSFLVEKLGFQTIASKQSRTKGSNFQCISLKNVPQPWFK